MNDLTGKKFWKLTVIKRSKKRSKSGHVLWECKCDCGNITEVTSGRLVTGHTISCGCAKKGVNAIDIAGKRFGRLIALSPTNKRLVNSIIWRCQCDCGNICDVAAINLRKGATKSCGCLASEVHSVSVSTARDLRKEYYVDGTDAIYLSQVTTTANNTSGYTGISYDRSVNVWKAHITFKGQRYYLGSAHCPEDLIEIRNDAKKHLHGDFLTWFAEKYPKQWEKLQKKRGGRE